MNIEKPSSSSIEIPDRHKLLAKYAERGDLYTESKPKKKYLNLSDETLSQIVESIDFTPKDLKNNPQTFYLQKGEFPVKIILDNMGILIHYAGDQIANFDFYKIDSKEWDVINLRHREVLTEFRGRQTEGGMSLANFAMKVIEKMLENSATQSNVSQKIIVDTGQIDVMYWLFNNGFQIPEEQARNNIVDKGHSFYDSSNGKEKWEMISRVDDRLFINKGNYIYSKEDIPKLDILSIHKKIAEKAEYLTTRHNAVRICFLKDIPVPSPAEETRDTIKKTLI